MGVELWGAFGYTWGVTSLLPNPAVTNRRQVASLSLLAKLLAAENISVVHRAGAQTASFDTKTRVLTLPVWKEMSGDLYDMLVAHEVGHALYSPKGDEWCKELEKLAPGAFSKMRQYVNIVEDARIERMMKDRYPGLRSNFARAYRDLTEKNPRLFALDKNLNDLPLIDRVNIHYKVGFAVEVPFEDAELAIVKRVAETKTWDDVVALAKELYDLSKQQKQQQDEQQDQDESDTSDGDADEQDGEESQSDGDEGNDQDSSDNGESDGEDQDGESADGGDESDDADADPTDGQQDEKESNKSKEGKTKGDEQSKDSSASKSKSKETEENAEADESVTEKMMEELSKQNATDDRFSAIGSVTLPTFLPQGIVEFKEVIDDLKVIADQHKGYEYYLKFLAKNKPAIAALVQEFMRRKAADESQRTRTADTGNIDPSRLWSYRVSDEIFGSYEIKREGKNHGIVFLLDWSGSMTTILRETVEQLSCLVQFCAAANIPCEVYAFTDGPFFDRGGKSVWSKDHGQVVPNEMRLLNILSASARPAQLKIAIAGLLALANTNRTYNATFGKNAKGECLTSKYYLNGTPLNAALTAMATVVPSFKKRTGVQIVNLCVLTDGDSTDRIYYRNGADGKSCSIYTADNSTGSYYGRDFGKVNLVGKQAVEDFNGDTAGLIRFLRAETGVTVLGFRIDSSRALTSTMRHAPASVSKTCEEAKIVDKKGLETYLKEKSKFLKDNDWVSGNEWFGYTEWFGVSNLKVDETDYLTDVDGESTKAALARALGNEMGKTKSSRPLMARIAQRVSVSAK